MVLPTLSLNERTHGSPGHRGSTAQQTTPGADLQPFSPPAGRAPPSAPRLTLLWHGRRGKLN